MHFLFFATFIWFACLKIRNGLELLTPQLGLHSILQTIAKNYCIYTVQEFIFIKIHAVLFFGILIVANYSS